MLPCEDFISAAVRHVRDAELLLAKQSRDQAWHLAGFSHECARKAYLEGSWVAKTLGHDFTLGSELVLEVAEALDPRVSRYPVTNWVGQHPEIRDWLPKHRYERSGSSKDRPVEALVSSARHAVDECMVSLLLDARLDMESVDDI